jgi:hypothetical protein
LTLWLCQLPSLASSYQVNSTQTHQALKPVSSVGSEANPESAPLLTLAYFNCAELPPDVSAAMDREVRAILAQLGIEVRALWNPEGQPADGMIHLKALLLPMDGSTMGFRDTVMGAVRGRNFPGTAVYVFYPNILAALKDPKYRSPTPEEVGRAVGRVVAHEVVHALGGNAHTLLGIMAQVMERDFLMQTKVTVRSVDSEELVHTLTRLLYLAAKDR